MAKDGKSEAVDVQDCRVSSWRVALFSRTLVLEKVVSVVISPSGAILHDAPLCLTCLPYP